MVNRGFKKDFWDLAYLLDKFELNDILKFYKKKYEKNNLWQVEKSLCYFNDADEEFVEIVDFQNQSWNAVKDKIQKASKTAF